MDSLTIEYLSTDESAKQLVLDYWERDEEDNFMLKVIEVAKKHSMQPPTVSTAVNKECIIYSNTIACENCKSPYEIRNRTHYKSKTIPSHWLCDECEQEEIQTQDKLKEKILAWKFKSAMGSYQDIKDHSLKDMLYLYSILEYTNNDYKSEIKPYNTVANGSKLSPTKNFDTIIYSELISKNILTVNPLKNLNNVHYLDNENVDFIWTEVSFLPTIHGYKNSLEDTIERMKAILFEKRWSGKHLDEITLISSYLLVNESISFAYYLSKRNQFRLHDNKYIEIFKIVAGLIKEYTVSQVNNLLFKAAKEAEDYYFTKNQDLDVAGKVFFSSFQRKVDSAIKSRWKISPLKYSNSPVTIINEVFFHDIMGVEEYGFNLLPNEII